MYKDASKKQRAASRPSERDRPFETADSYKGKKMAKNDPVGLEVYKSNSYGEDKAVNWVDRS